MARGFALALLTLASAAVLVACGSDADPASRPGRAVEEARALANVGGVLELRAAFNADSGSPRLLLLLSPT